MLGYVTCEKAELKMKDYERYSGYYCGVCKSIGSRYGQLPRMVLSYDAAFLALLLAGIEDTAEEDVAREHCLVHPVKEKTVVRNGAIDYAADVMLILAWHKLLDDIADEGRRTAKTAKIMSGKIYRRIRHERAVLCNDLQKQLAEMNILEHEKCSSLDRAAEPFAKIMEIIFTGYEGGRAAGTEGGDKRLASLGYHLGKWIYLMDAWEDIEENAENGSYNPLIYRYGFDEKQESQLDFRKRIYDDCERNLTIYLSQISEAYKMLDIKKNDGIIENIIYFGLLRRTENALGSCQQPGPRSEADEQENK